MVLAAHGKGFPVAIHCIEEDTIAAAAAVLAANRISGLTDRIEHCAEGTPELVEAVRRSGAMVATQPGFIYHNGTSYRENVEQRLLPHLYPSGGLLRAGVPTAFGSDAPVIDPNPWPAIYSAVTRNALDGRPLSDEDVQAVSVEQALRMHTLAGARAEALDAEKGSIAPGKLADLVLVNSDPSIIDPECLPDIRTILTIVGGSVVWEKT